MKDKRESSACVCVCREGERHRQTEREGESYNKDPPDSQAVLTCSISPLLLATQPGLCLLTHLPQATKGSRCEVVFRHTCRHELRRADGNLANIAGRLGVSKEKHLRSWGFPPGVSAGWSRPVPADGQTKTRDSESKCNKYRIDKTGGKDQITAIYL